MVPRWRNHDAYDPSRRPHHNTTYQCVNVVAYCAKCEEEVEKEKTIGIGEWCDCDRYERWVCLRCVEIESAEEEWYHSHCDELTYRLDPEHCGSGSGLVLPDHQGRRMVSLPPPHVVYIYLLIWMAWIALVSMRQTPTRGKRRQRPLYMV